MSLKWKMSNWDEAARISLFLFLVSQIAIIAFSTPSAFGVARFNPYFYFGIFLIGLPWLLFAAFVVTYFVARKKDGERIYARLAWDLLTFLFAASTSLLLATLPAVSHLVTHQDSVVLTGEAGTSNYITHFSSAAGSTMALFWTLNFIDSWVFDAYTTKIFQLRTPRNFETA